MNVRTDTERNDYLDYLKGILILLVVYGHTIQFLVYKHSEEFWYDPAFKFIYIFHMPLFMAVSGFVSSGSMGRSTALETIRKRFLQLIVPIFCWEILYESIVVFTAVAADRVGMVRALTVLPRLIVEATIDGFWFLQCVFFSTVIVSVLRWIKLDHAAAFAVLCIAVLFLPDMYVLDHMFRYTFPFFCAGYSLAKWKSDILPLKASPFWLLLGGLAVSLVSYAIWTKESYVYVTAMELTGVNLFQVPFRYVSGAAVSAAFLVLTSLIYKKYKSKILTELGRASMSIYILQTFFFVIASGFAPVSENRILLSLTVAPVLAFLFALFLYALTLGIRRFSPTRKLLLGDYKERTGTRHAVADA
jgi:fucose 4-O-acetylase-like acetyltransferase